MIRLAAVLTEPEVRDPVLPRYELPGWRREFGIVAGITAAGEGLNFRLDGRTEPFPDPWQRLSRALGAQFRTVVVGRQEHTANVAVHRSTDPGWHSPACTDGLITQLKGVLLCATVADCIPVYLAHPQSNTIGLLHAGWRGTAAGILESGVKELLELAGATPADCIIHCGVGICGQCYEVSSQVAEAVWGCYHEGRLLDLRSALVARASRIGVERITVSPWCTAHDQGRFYSHRTQGPTAGRMVAYVGLA